MKIQERLVEHGFMIYLGRGTQMNRSLTVKEWCAIVRECLEAV